MSQSKSDSSPEATLHRILAARASQPRPLSKKPKKAQAPHDPTKRFKSKHEERPGFLTASAKLWHPHFIRPTKATTEDHGQSSNLSDGSKADADCARILRGERPITPHGHAFKWLLHREGWTLLKTQVDVYDRITGIGSAVDALVKDREGRLILIELKTGYVTGYKRASGQMRYSLKNIDNSHYSHHQTQIGFYADLLREMGIVLHDMKIVVSRGQIPGSPVPDIVVEEVQPWARRGILEKFRRDRALVKTAKAKAVEEARAARKEQKEMDREAKAARKAQEKAEREEERILLKAAIAYEREERKKAQAQAAKDRKRLEKELRGRGSQVRASRKTSSTTTTATFVTTWKLQRDEVVPEEDRCDTSE